MSQPRITVSLDTPFKSTKQSLTIAWFLGVGTALGTVVGAMYVLPRLHPEIYSGFPYLTLTLPALLLIDLGWSKLTKSWRQLAAGFTSGVIIYFLLSSAFVIEANRYRQPDWDLRNFWIHARLAVNGQDFYSVPLAVELANRFGGPPNADFLSQIDFPYPPPSMLFIAPMGWANMETSFPIWQWFHLAFLGLSAVLMWQLFLRDRGRVGLLLSTALLAAFPSTMDTIYMGQMNFVMLAMLLLYARDRNTLHGGLWLAIGILVKPSMMVVALLPLLGRETRTIIGLLLSTLIFCLVAAFFFSPNVFGNWVESLSGFGTTRLTLGYNQSLLATILRSQVDQVSFNSILHPVFLVLAGIIVLLSAVPFLMHKPASHTEWALMLPLSLIIFPHSLYYYSIILVPPMLLMLKIPGPRWVRLIIYAITFWLIYIMSTGFGSNMLISSIMGWAGLWLSLIFQTTAFPLVHINSLHNVSPPIQR